MVSRDKIVLDLGCLDAGIGALFIKNNNKVYGIDVSDEAIKTARQRGLDVKTLDSEEPLDYPSEMFDVVFASEVIEHVYDIDQWLSQIYRILKKGGKLMVLTPNLASLGRRLLLLFNLNPHIEVSYRESSAGHIRYFVKSTLCDILK
jgi:ubiquinone/menaquinone biosynthesis C-methylase UbiE